MRWQSLWSPKNQRVSFKSIYREDGSITDTAEEAAELLAAYWHNETQATPADDDAIKQVLSNYHKQFTAQHIDQWLPTYQKFVDRLDASHDSGTGPDGLVYSFLKKAPPPIKRALYNLTIHVMKGGNVSEEFNYA